MVIRDHPEMTSPRGGDGGADLPVCLTRGGDRGVMRAAGAKFLRFGVGTIRFVLAKTPFLSVSESVSWLKT